MKSFVGHWKYSLEKDDLVRFKYDPSDEYTNVVESGRDFDNEFASAEGTVLGTIMPPEIREMDNPTYDDVSLDTLGVRIKSGDTVVDVSLSAVDTRLKRASEREDEITHLSERMRLSGGLSNL